MPTDNGKPKSTENDPEQLARLLELELMQKRAAWQQASARHRAIKSASFLFLAIVILAAIVGAYLIFTRVGGQQRPQPVSTEETR